MKRDDDAQASPEERRRLLEQLPESTPLTLERAAYLAGYLSATTLRTAAQHGRLQVDRHGPRTVLTTAGDLLAYLSSLDVRGAARGRPRPRHDETAEKEAPGAD